MAEKVVPPVIRHRRQVKRILLKRNGYQFGQAPATCSLVTDVTPGDVGCADTSIQMVARIIKGQWYSLNYIRRKSGNAPHVPMRVGNAVVALRALGLSYAIRDDLDAGELLDIARKRGPVLIAEDYWAHPQWKGYRYLGRTMDGRARTPSGRTVRVGFADPLERAGSNQWTFNGGHMVLLATSRIRDGEEVGFVRDPNHNSRVRPERPAWDAVTQGQLRRMLRSFNRGRGVVAIVPTKSLWR